MYVFNLLRRAGLAMTARLLKPPSFHPPPPVSRRKHAKRIGAAACLGTFSVGGCQRRSYGRLARHMKVTDESFPLPGRGAELN